MPVRSRSSLVGCLGSLLWATGAAHAQGVAAPLAPVPAAAGAGTVVVTGNPLGHDDSAQPASVLSGEALAERRAATLGETLDGLPGVSSTAFGPNAARPVIRGLDGDRVRLLDNGGASVDASNLSFDHAVAIDPLAVERVEVLRGPAALLYGGNATGGVVNTIDNRIPREAIGTLLGRAELRAGGAASERGGAAVLEGGTDRLAWHADGFARSNGDQRVPRFTPVEDGQPLLDSGHVRNSEADASGGAVGASWVGRNGYLGASFDGYRNHYGVTAEPDVTIRMRRDRLALAGEARSLGGPLSTISFKASHTDYRHEEIEGTGDVGTTFTSTGSDWRMEAQQARFALGGGTVSGVLGLQGERLDFQALGEEAFVPSTTTRSDALFTLQNWERGAWSLAAGVRAEQVTVDSAGDTAEVVEPRFGAATSRRFQPVNGSLSATYAASPDWHWNLTLGHTERAPAYYELFANGLHVATAAYEQGDPALGIERSRHVEAGMHWKTEPAQVEVHVYETRFSRFIALEATGQTVASGDGDVPLYAFSGVPARLRGAEIDGHWRVMEAPVSLLATGGLDIVRGTNTDTGEPLPRLPPLRLRLGLEAAQGAWRGGASVRAAARQTRVPEADTETPGWAMLDLYASWQLPLDGVEAVWRVKLDNVTNRLAYNATTTETVRGLAPLPGRALSTSVSVRF